MIIKNAQYETTAVRPEQYPTSQLPEIAFAGRSNAGKSSLINSLVNRKSLARIGSTPGMTRTVNFFNVDDAFYLVDLPGYGFANVSKGEREAWGQIIETYLTTRIQLRLIILLVDIRHEPTDDDKLMQKWLDDNNLPYLVIATKADKISRSQINVRLRAIARAFGLGDENKPLAYSSQSKQGRDELLAIIEDALS